MNLKNNQDLNKFLFKIGLVSINTDTLKKKLDNFKEAKTTN